ncbi:hypothetical protein FRC12_014926 [Ceratobasidium sp. 428]|nr:hypothetical protein FRC12_014926 [Ceratobasidium sp. 428]
MASPESQEYRDRYADGYAEVKFVNQVLSTNPYEKPRPTCLLVNLGNGSNVAVQGDRDVLAERTGSPKFIARSVAERNYLGREFKPSDELKMPGLTDTKLETRMHKTPFTWKSDKRDYNPNEDLNSMPKFTHQLYHDAESTFWVLVWVLARSSKPQSQPGVTTSVDLRTFANQMTRHDPAAGTRDGRNLIQTDLSSWEDVLHVDLRQLVPMVSQMHQYVKPEWGYRDANPEHVHEAMMRLLLNEICRIDRGALDNIPLSIGTRVIAAP